MKSTYYCVKCNRNHLYSSNIGKLHLHSVIIKTKPDTSKDIISVIKEYSDKSKLWTPFNVDEKVWWEDQELGYCYLASYKLAKYLEDNNIKAQIVYGEFDKSTHYWVEATFPYEILGRHIYWIDPTYYQFEQLDKNDLICKPIDFIRKGYKVEDKFDADNKEFIDYLKYTIGELNLKSPQFNIK